VVLLLQTNNALFFFRRSSKPKVLYPLSSLVSLSQKEVKERERIKRRRVG